MRPIRVEEPAATRSSKPPSQSVLALLFYITPMIFALVAIRYNDSIVKNIAVSSLIAGTFFENIFCICVEVVPKYEARNIIIRGVINNKLYNNRYNVAWDFSSGTPIM